MKAYYRVTCRSFGKDMIARAASSNPPLEGEGRERSERGGVDATRQGASPPPSRPHPPTASASLRRSTLPLQGRVDLRRGLRAIRRRVPPDNANSNPRATL